jgi:O-acetylhomoserine/O-acetylserine sulfhydrylase-like pyridoxal-dependent enzyme
VVLGSEAFVKGHLHNFLKHTGPSMSPFNAWVFLKGLETLPIRVRAQCETAARLADRHAERPEVGRVLFCGRADHPKAALALLRRLEGLTGVAVDASELEDETRTYEEQVGRAVAANPEIEELVGRIEEEQAEQFTMPEEVPSADALARDFQRFLRQRGSGG